MSAETRSATWHEVGAQACSYAALLVSLFGLPAVGLLFRAGKIGFLSASGKTGVALTSALFLSSSASHAFDALHALDLSHLDLFQHGLPLNLSAHLELAGDIGSPEFNQWFDFANKLDGIEDSVANAHDAMVVEHDRLYPIIEDRLKNNVAVSSAVEYERAYQVAEKAATTYYLALFQYQSDIMAALEGGLTPEEISNLKAEGLRVAELERLYNQAMEGYQEALAHVGVEQDA